MTRDVRENTKRATEALAGTAAVVLLVAATKWGAYLGVPPLFLTDALLALAVTHAVVSRGKLGVRPPGDAPASGSPSVLLSLLVVYACLRLVAGGQLDVLALRDFAPYFYAVVGLLSAGAYYRSGPVNRERTATLLWRALLFHLVWVAAARFIPGVSDFGPSLGEGTGLFHIRTDVDGAILGVTAAWAFIRWIRQEGRAQLLVVLASWLTLFALTSRAALMGGMLAAVLAMAVMAHTGHGTRLRRQVVVGVAPLLLIAVMVALPQTVVGSRLLSTFGSNSLTQERTDLPSAEGTTQARERAWRAVTHYVRDDPARSMVGVGFGPDFMHESGADVALIGSAYETGVRSPHNYYVGTFARLGWPGAILVGLVALVGSWKAWRLRRRMAEDDVLLFAGLITLALIPPAAFGVTLESPFGAVPFFWAVGILFAARRPAAARRPPVSAGARRREGEGQAFTGALST